MHAELLLNLTWLAITGGIVVMAFTPRVENQRSYAAKVILVLVLASILFPAISMTDDIHTPIIVCSETDRLLSLEQAAFAALVVAVVFIFVVSPTVIFRLSRDKHHSTTCDGFIRAAAGRAPPIAA